ncbi:MAG: threonine synthase [Desulfuromonadales bacterium]|nr:threonine synthase [Desulfuromonadales bacterium]MBN2792385.1 threonine synthase [Desulfuromonadales bacterium]
MNYCSTRGEIRGLKFTQAVMMGLADDGGLLLPESIPVLSAEELRRLSTLTYPELAFAVISKFADDIPPEDLREIIERSYSSFNHPQVTPVTKQDDLYILELFHGPTLAFKDVALQFLGNLFEYLLNRSGQRMNIIGATSGDTGSAAIYGVRGKKNINIFILHPKGKVSPVQELQMTTVTDDNVFNIAVEGTFDDAQAIVKEIFGDLDFKSKHALGAVNSINWARVLAQVVYYFYAWFQISQENQASQFEVSVPTGNFGDIFAGFVAKRMGLPIHRLILATNENNILSRFINHGDYSTADVHHSLSPSMDIQIASNFERYLYYLLDEQADQVLGMMDQFAHERKMVFSSQQIEKVQQEFSAASVNDLETLDTIRQFHALTGYILDPHTAVGVAVGKKLRDPKLPLVCLATAHPAKFGDAVAEATGIYPELPPALGDLSSRKRKLTTLPAQADQVKKYLSKNAT